MDDITGDAAETLFEARSESHTYRVTLDDERTFEVTTTDFEYESAAEDEEGKGYLQCTIEFFEAPEVHLKPDRHATDLGEIGIVETNDSWGTPTLHARVQHVEDNDIIRWEYPVLGTIATVEEADK